MKDVLKAESVEIYIDSFGKLWINTEKGCILRIGQCDNVIIDTSAGTPTELKFKDK